MALAADLVLESSALGLRISSYRDYYGGLLNENQRVPYKPVKSEVLVS